MKKITTTIIFFIILNSYSQCKDIFIGNVYQFKNNDLFSASILEKNNADYYIDIFLNEEFDKDNLNLKYIDSYDSTRQEINKDIANKAFNLKELDTIYFYSKLNNLIGYGTYKKAEYYEYYNGSQFIGAYKPYISDYSQRPYYTSNCKINSKKIKWIKSENKDLENKIINYYNIKGRSMLEIFHYTNSNSNITYSMVTYDNLKVLSDFPYLNSFIVKYQNGELTKLYETGSDFILNSILISPFTFNNEPIILIGANKPESDFYFNNAPIFYDGIKYNFRDGDRSGFENQKGDFNGDGTIESVFIKNPEFPKGSSEDVYGDCIGSCDCYLKFSDKNIPSIKIENCIGGEPENLGDLNNDGLDEIGILPQWWTGCWMNYKVYTFKNGNWKYLVEPIKTHCNSWTENFKIIEKDSNLDGNVIIRYTEMSENMDFVTKTKSIKVN